MTLEDFERELAESSNREKERGKDRERREHRRDRHRDRDRDRDDHESSRHRHRRHRSSRHGDDRGNDEERHRHKRSRNSTSNGEERERSHKRRHRHRSPRDETKPENSNNDNGPPLESVPEAEEPVKLKRDAWMEAPSALDVDYVQRRTDDKPEPPKPRMLQADFGQKLHDKELNRHLHDVQEETTEEAGIRESMSMEETKPEEVDYTFGDAGSQWRMTKLRAVYRQAKETDRSVEEVAIERFGDLQSFDNAREEETELDRRDTYGRDYVGKEKPTGELFQERKLDMGITRERQGQRRRSVSEDEIKTPPQGEQMQTKPVTHQTVPLDSTALNRLKAQMMKAKLRGASDAADLEAQYNTAIAQSANRKESDVVVLGVMDNRLLAGKREEVRPVETKRGKERGQVEENQDMSIDDMVREERRTRGQAGGDGMRFAERIAKDAKFDVSFFISPLLLLPRLEESRLMMTL